MAPPSKTQIAKSTIAYPLLPDALVHALQEGVYLPVIGWGYPDFASTTGVVMNRLRSMAATEDGYQRSEAENLAKRWLAVASPHIWPLYEAVAELPVKSVIALTPDSHLFRILNKSNPGWIPITEAHFDLQPGYRYVLQLAGQEAHPESMAIVNSDYLRLSAIRQVLWEIAESFAARAPLLILGCDPADSVQRSVLGRLRMVPPHSHAGWVVCHSSKEKDTLTWNNLGFQVIEVPVPSALRQIVLAGKFQKTSLPARIVPKFTWSPYKRLDFFEPEENGIFFGREKETSELLDMVCGHRLVVVTGASGVGKTSLLNAGLLAQMDELFGHVGVRCRCGSDPITAIQNAIASEFNVGLQHDDDRSLVTLLFRARDTLQRLPLVVLDQAEELFTLVPERLRNDLLVAIRDCLLAMPAVARFALVLREDYLARLTECRDYIPNVLQNVFYLKQLNRQEAMAATVSPAELAGVQFEKALAEKILADLGSDNIEPPQIQIVCSELYERRRGDTIDHKVYSELGGTRGILEHYLRDALLRLNDDAADARVLLKAMVTSEQTKDVLSATEIANRSNLPLSRVSTLLAALKDKLRLIRSVAGEAEVKFELAHEYLTTEIWSWMTELDLARRTVEELIARELKAWQRYRQLRLGVDRLKVLEKNPQFVLGEDALVFTLLSAVKYQRSRDPWIAKVTGLDVSSKDRICSALFEFFQEKDVHQRREAAEAIGELDVSPLLRALNAPAKNRRRVAIEMLGGIECKAAVEDIRRILENDEDMEIRILACGALGEIDGPAVPDALRKAIDDAHVPVAAAAIAALGRVEIEDVSGDIRQVLLTGNPELCAAVRTAIRFTRNPRLISRLLKDNTLPPTAREHIWAGLDDAMLLTRKSLMEVVEFLSANEQEKAVQIFQRFRDKPNRDMRRRFQTGVLGKWVQEIVEHDERRRNEHVDCKIAAKKLLAGKPSLLQLKDCLERTNFDLWYASVERIARLAEARLETRVLLETLLKESDGRVCVGVLVALEDMKLPWTPPGGVLSRLLLHADASVRYWACLVALRHGIKEVSDDISDLIDDAEETSIIYQEGHGMTVGEAARGALNVLRPSSKVWRKPFQRSFAARKSD